ncbi:hypothetical protein ACOME3_009951 [Neoechinorhynchus agilis]
MNLFKSEYQAMRIVWLLVSSYFTHLECSNFMRTGMFATPNKYGPIDDRVILENYIRNQFQLKPYEGATKPGNCTAALMNILQNGNLISGIQSRPKPVALSNLLSKSESSYPFRQTDLHSSQMMAITLDALEVLREKLRKAGCHSTELPTALKGLENIDSMLGKLIIPQQYCPFHDIQYACSPGSRFRAMDGSCNNLDFPWFGKSKMPFARFLPPQYSDYMGAARFNSSNSLPLPDSSIVAHNLMFDRRQNDFRITNLFPIFAQLVFNDLYTTTIRGTRSKICDCNVPNNDDCMFFGYLVDECVTFPRSASTFVSPKCALMAREQINAATSWLDLSPIYGNNDEDAERVRSFRKGKLTVVNFNDMEYPNLVENEFLCVTGYQGKCFDSGDRRINENMGSVTIYTLFIREHNRIAEQLSTMNPLWKDEELYQEARRINIAQYQHIIAKEFLPILVGPDVALNSDILPLTRGYNWVYNSKLNPNVRNEIASAIGPSMLTMFRDTFSLYSPHMVKIDEISLRDNDFKINHAFNTSTQGIDALMRGMLVDYAGRYDRHFAHSLHDPDLIKSVPSAAILVGRDHGLASYNDYRELCGLSRLTGFNDLGDIMDLETIALLSFLYRDVNSIELLTGAISELPLKNALVGPTLSCLITNQFSLLKHTDRFHYETSHPVTKFSNYQLNEIRRSSLARMICENFHDLPFIQPNAFISNFIHGNTKRPCSLFKGRSMDAWYDLKQNKYTQDMRGPEIVAIANGLDFV